MTAMQIVFVEHHTISINQVYFYTTKLFKRIFLLILNTKAKLSKIENLLFYSVVNDVYINLWRSIAKYRDLV